MENVGNKPESSDQTRDFPCHRLVKFAPHQELVPVWALHLAGGALPTEPKVRPSHGKIYAQGKCKCGSCGSVLIICANLFEKNAFTDVDVRFVPGPLRA